MNECKTIKFEQKIKKEKHHQSTWMSYIIPDASLYTPYQRMFLLSQKYTPLIFIDVLFRAVQLYVYIGPLHRIIWIDDSYSIHIPKLNRHRIECRTWTNWTPHCASTISFHICSLQSHSCFDTVQTCFTTT